MKIEIYTLDYCPYCKKAIAFLNEKNLEFTQIRIDDDEDSWFQKLAKMLNKKATDVTVPQIFIDGNQIGGYSDMMELYSQDKIFN